MDIAHSDTLKLDARVIGDRIDSLLPYDCRGDKNKPRLQDLFKRAGVEEARVIERAVDKGIVPKWEDLLAIAKCFNVSMDYLLGRTTVPAIAQPCTNRIDSAIKTIAEYTKQSYDDVCEQLGISEDEILNY